MKGLFFITIAAYVAYIVYAQAPAVDCPPYDENSEGPYLVPHPCNCSAYYVCFSPINIPMPCPVGLHFNNTSKQCDWPWLAKCKLHPNCPVPMIQDAALYQEEVASHEESGAVSHEQEGGVSQEQGKLSATFFH